MGNGAKIDAAKALKGKAAGGDVVKDLSVPSFTIYAAEAIGIQRDLDRTVNKIIGEAAKNKKKTPAEIAALRDKLGTGEIMGLYVPPALKSQTTVNVIIYIHGNKVRNVDSTSNIQDYWTLPDFPLREGLNKSGKPFVLLAPTLGQFDQFGSLDTKIESLLDDAMTYLDKHGKPEFTPGQKPVVGDIIVAGHSGAYKPMLLLIKGMKRYKSNIKEIWGFDIGYGDLEQDWAQLAAAQGGPFIYAYFVGTECHSRNLAVLTKTLNNVFVMEGVEIKMVGGKEQRTEVPHDNLLKRFWLDRLQRIGSNGTDLEDTKRKIKGGRWRDCNPKKKDS